MKSRFMVVLATISIVQAGTGLLNATTPGTSNNVQLVGQNSLFGRGMNAAAANYKNFLYVGNRTDGSSRCGFGDPRRANGLDSCPHPHPGILIVDISNPASPTVAGEIPAPLNPAGQPCGCFFRFESCPVCASTVIGSQSTPMLCTTPVAARTRKQRLKCDLRTS